MGEMPAGVRIKRGRLQISYQVKGERVFEMLTLKPTERNIAEAARIRKERKDDTRYGLRTSEPRSTKLFEPVTQAYLDPALVAGDQFRLALSSRNTSRDALNQFWFPALGKTPIAWCPRAAVAGNRRHDRMGQPQRRERTRS